MSEKPRTIPITQTAYYRLPNGQMHRLFEGSCVVIPESHPKDQPYVLENLGQGELLQD